MPFACKEATPVVRKRMSFLVRDRRDRGDVAGGQNGFMVTRFGSKTGFEERRGVPRIVVLLFSVVSWVLVRSCLPCRHSRSDRADREGSLCMVSFPSMDASESLPGAEKRLKNSLKRHIAQSCSLIAYWNIICYFPKGVTDAFLGRDTGILSCLYAAASY